jgi:predicted nucleotidyltransferase
VTGVAPATLDRIRGIAASAAGLRLLILFGSRARGDAHTRSDWDFGFIATPAFDVAALLAGFVEALDTEAIDLVDLERASGLLRYRVARDGYTVFEDESRLGERFRLEAVHFWCDAAPVLERGYRDVLTSLG